MTSASTDTTVAVTITAAKHPRIRTLTASCGTTFRYERHMEHRGVTSLLIACVCRHGHGPAHTPWRGWVSLSEAKMTLTDIPTPTSSYAFPTDEEIEAASIITLDQVGTRVPNYRAPVAAPAAA
jgi:hypothetical protein